VEFVVNKAALGRVIYEYFGFPITAEYSLIIQSSSAE
jgi:hypothetical protein